ncbi:MAG TPA: deoxyguanosinetriphosphate triphosphohydrolase [Gammaproteobacteria bacterium]
MAAAAHPLAPYAATDRSSRGRVHDEAPAAPEAVYLRDRERVIHSAAFRRLEYKTQVFVNHEGDLFRTRLTHTIEVAQVARVLARRLALNEDLAEVIALAHDLGHTPFGHAGQEALNGCLRDHGGFEHNRQSLRVVDELEESFAEFDGLNLSFETREGILKHCAPVHAARLGELGRRFIDGGQPTLEAQLTNLADEIAYNAHDVDDGLRSGLIDERQLLEVDLFRQAWEEVRGCHPGLPRRRTVHVVVRALIAAQVDDLCSATSARLEAAAPADADAVRASAEPLVLFSAEMQRRNGEIKRFLRENLYRHYRVRRMALKAQRVIQELYAAFAAEPRLLPTEVAERVARLEAQEGEAGRVRGVADYIAGMTDRYAFTEHARLFQPQQLT